MWKQGNSNFRRRLINKDWQETEFNTVIRGEAEGGETPRHTRR
jgi:hypothetical protein